MLCSCLQLRVDLSLDMILSPRDGPTAVGVLDALQEGSEASTSVAGTSSSAAGPSGECVLLVHRTLLALTCFARSSNRLRTPSVHHHRMVPQAYQSGL